jgi:predicted nucleic acid-binding protein
MASTEPARLIDTSVLVDLLRGNTQAARWIDTLPRDSRWISVVTAVELLAGCRNRAEERTVDRELAQYNMIHVDENISEQALSLYRLHHLSHGDGFLDCLIAASAIRHNLRIATLNVRHFTPLPGVQVEAPY